MTPSGLNTHVSAPSTLPNGQINYNITGGTRPGNGPNLFHSFGDFSVGPNNIANFLNDTGLPTTNILSRVMGGNPSNIFGTLQTTGFGNANLFLINPAGVVFGPTASLNVGGSVHISTANYVKLADGVRFNALPGPQDALLSSAPVAAFGFLGSSLPNGQAGMITVQPGATLTVATGHTISLVGRDNPNGVGQQAGVAIIGGVLDAEAGGVNLVSVGKPQQPAHSGEVAIGNNSLTPSGFRSMGTVLVMDGATVSTSTKGTTSLPAGTVSIRAGELVVTNSTIAADGTGLLTQSAGGAIDVGASSVKLDGATITANSEKNSGGPITFHDLRTFTSVDSTIQASEFRPTGLDATGGPITIGSPDTRSVTLTRTNLDSSSNASPLLPSTPGGVGAIAITSKHIAIDGGRLSSIAGVDTTRDGGTITLNGDRIAMTNNAGLSAMSFLGGTAGGRGEVIIQGLMSTDMAPTSARSVVIDHSGVRLGTFSNQPEGGRLVINAVDLDLNAASLIAVGLVKGGTIDLTNIGRLSMHNSGIDASSSFGNGGTILLGSPATRSLILDNSTIAARGDVFQPQSFNIPGHGGTISITARDFRSTGSTLDASSGKDTGGTVSIRAGRLSLVDSTITAQGPGTNGTVSLEVGKKLTIQNTSITPEATITLGWTNQ